MRTNCHLAVVLCSWSLVVGVCYSGLMLFRVVSCCWSSLFVLVCCLVLEGCWLLCLFVFVVVCLVFFGVDCCVVLAFYFLSLSWCAMD